MKASRKTKRRVDVIEIDAATCRECGSIVLDTGKCSNCSLQYAMTYTCRECPQGVFYDALVHPDATKARLCHKHFTEKSSEVGAPARRRLSDTRPSKTRKLKLPGMKMYATVGFFPDGKPGEVFIRAEHAGSFTSGILDGLAISISLGLQYGVPMADFIRKFKATKFEPAGVTGDSEHPITKSALDYLAFWFEKLEKEKGEQEG